MMLQNFTIREGLSRNDPTVLKASPEPVRPHEGMNFNIRSKQTSKLEFDHYFL